MAIYCPQCGKPNLDEARQCTSCNSVLRAPSDAPKRFKGTMIMGNPYAPDPEHTADLPDATVRMSSDHPALRQESQRPSQRTAGGKRTLIGGPGFLPPVPQGAFSESSPPSGTVRIGSEQAHATFSAIKSARPISFDPNASRTGVRKYFGPLGPWGIGVCALSFIPVYGVPFALLALVWGWMTRRQGGATLALLGTLGFVVSCMLALGFGIQALQQWLGG